ncbi:hypothetical protein [Campylobacter mucosalis]|uniref:Chromosome segregation ATPase n=1 Tax=Campylobacter mucosalis CCUG 21559 TaxID=1032067 RepID=A0A6G5QI11_9BACT|nr:hypothetical protein [Campylobacter mucosalis]QCD45136.1 hypothetical protein CMUC_1372 [Campylobacter mucosalis CCUG 21559]
MSQTRVVVAVIIAVIAFILVSFLSNISPKTKETESEYKIYSLKFDDLPESEKEKYINKSNLYEYGGYITPKSYSQSFAVSEDNGTSILELLSQNKALVADNIDLGEKNLELIEKIESIKNELTKQKDEVVAQSDRALNEQEEQHYQNIQKLTKELSEAQKNGLNSISSYEKKIAMLENEMIKFKLDVDKNKTIATEEFLSFKRQSDANQSELRNLNNTLNFELNASLAKFQNINKELAHIKDELERANAELGALKSENKKELGRVLDGFDLQKSILEDELSRKSNKIIDLNAEILNLTLELNASKKNMQRLVNNLEAEKNTTKKLSEISINLNSKNAELNATKAKLKEALNSLDIEKNATILLKQSITELKMQSSELNSTRAKLLKTREELSIEQNSTRNLKQNLKELKAQNSDLNSTIAIKSDSINELTKSINELKNMLDLKNNNIKNLENNLSATKTELKTSQNELKNLQKTSSVDMKNYEILTSQINALKKQLGGKLNEQNVKDDISLAQLKDELNRAKTTIKDNNKTIIELNERIANLGKSSMSTSEYYKKIEELSKDIEENLNNQDRLEDENTNLKMLLEAQTKPEVPKKLVFVSKIECYDMDSKNEPTQICKNRLSDFLQRYNSNYIYEIIAIVDEKGLGLPYEVAKTLKKDELERLKKYVNEGVAKERAVVAARLIKDEFGDFARISFSPDFILKNSSRGFVIKAYR